MNNYDFPITRQVIRTQDDIAIPHRFAVVRTDTQAPIGIVSDRYALLTHSAVVDGFRDALDGQNYTEEIKVTDGGARLYYKMTLNDITMQIGGSDIALQLIAENSYNATRSLRVLFGAFRFICSNGMIVGEKFISLSRRHMGTTVGLQADTIKKQISLITSQFQLIAPVMQRMNHTALVRSPIEFFDPKTIQIPKYLLKIAQEHFANDTHVTTWSAYNALTYAISHHMKKENPQASITYGKRAYQAAVESMDYL